MIVNTIWLSYDYKNDTTMGVIQGTNGTLVKDKSGHIIHVEGNQRYVIDTLANYVVYEMEGLYTFRFMGMSIT
jgi:hypothetical protein